MTPSVAKLVSKLNAACRVALENAAGLAQARTNYNVEIEHWLIKLVESGDTDLVRMLRHYGADSGRLTRELNRSLEGLKTGSARIPALSPDIPDLMQEA